MCRLASEIAVLALVVTALMAWHQSALADDGATQITTLGGSYPDWSPDGSQIAFSSDRSGNFDIWVIPATGGTATPITTDPGRDVDPSWSPDGSQIAFRSDRSGNGDIWVIPATGGAATPITTSPANDEAPTWSPDGTKIAFSSYRSGNGNIWVIPATGGTATPITTGPVHDWLPTWSPDGTKIAFGSDRSDNLDACDIWVIPIVGGVATQVTDAGEKFESWPDWSPDGTRIAFAAHGLTGVRIFVVPPTGGTWTPVTNFLGTDWQPSWSPDGCQIAFKRLSDIWVIDVGGASATEPTTWSAVKRLFRD